MKSTIKTRDLLLVLGGAMIGICAGKVMIKKAKQECKKEIINDMGKTIKNEIKNDIEERINVDKIKKEIIAEINSDIIDDILDQNKKDKEYIRRELESQNDKLRDFEDRVLDFDKRVGKIITGGITTIMHGINKEA
jgi:hypothetical protein